MEERRAVRGGRDGGKDEEKEKQGEIPILVHARYKEEYFRYK